MNASPPSEWQLVGSNGHAHPLPLTMVFLGREECDINVQFQGIDKRHAVITFDHYLNKFKVKDLGTLNGTFVNDRRITEQTYMTLEAGDYVRLGYDMDPLRVERISSVKRVAPGSEPKDSVIEGLTRSYTAELAYTDTNPKLTERIGKARGPSDSADPDSRPYSRPKWDQRPTIAECQGCIREQNLQHSCGVNSELTCDNMAHWTDPSRGSPVSPLHLLTKLRQGSPTGSKRGSPSSSRRGSPTGSRRSRCSSVDESMPEDPIPMTHVLRSHEPHLSRTAHDITTHSLERRRITDSVGAAQMDASFVANRKGTPLYGQPLWWGESDADEHNRQIMQDIQRHIDAEKEQQKAILERRTHNSQEGDPSVVQPAAVPFDPVPSLSFAVGLDDLADEEKLLTGEKLSNFMPAQLRRSFRERRERLERMSLAAERSAHGKSSPVHAASPTIEGADECVSKGKPPIGPTKSDSCALKSKGSASFLISKMLCTELSSSSDHDLVPIAQPEIEGKKMSRSATMPELVQSSEDPILMRSRTLDREVFDAGEDNVSESGTYTIDEDNEELTKAREDIDKLFGITESRGLTNISPDGPSSASPDALDTSRACIQSPVQTSPSLQNHDNRNGYKPQANGSSTAQPRTNGFAHPYSNGTRIISPVDEQKGEEHAFTEKNGYSRKPEERKLVATAAVTIDDVVLTKPPVSPSTQSPRSSPKNFQSSGRKLPAIPYSATQKPLVGESSKPLVGVSNKPDEMPIRRKKEELVSKEKLLQELGIGESPVIEKERPKLMEEILTTRTYHREDDPILVNKTSFFDKIVNSSGEPEHSAVKDTTRRSQTTRRSTDSMATEVLLQDTDEFMKAIHSYSDTGSKFSQSRYSSKDFDKLNNNNTQNGVAKMSSSSSALTDVAPLRRIHVEDMTCSKRNAADDSTPSKKNVSDATSTRLSSKSQRVPAVPRFDDSKEASSESLISNKSQSLTSSTKKNSSLGAKQALSTPSSLARPNRTFEMRRSRAESTENDSARTSSSALGPRHRSSSADRSEISLGAKIVQRSRDNAAVNSPKVSTIKRNDGGRFSMRATAPSSKPASTPNKKPTLSRNNSNSAVVREQREKEADREREKQAWERRRSYDPRRAVQESKSKTKSNGEASADSSPRLRSNSFNGTDRDSLCVSVDGDTRHSADMFISPPESSRKPLAKEGSLDSSHEQEIAALSHELAKDLEILTRGDGESSHSPEITGGEATISRETEVNKSTEELVNSMFACQEKKSAFSSYRSSASVTPETSTQDVSPLRKKISSSQSLDNGSPSIMEQSYNGLIMASILQLSQKLKTSTTKTVTRLKDRGIDISTTPSPTEDFQTDIPASHELADILRTLKRVEHNTKVMEKAFFSTSGSQSELSSMASNEHEHYLAEIKRIRNEIAGFKPIVSDDATTLKKPVPAVPATEKVSSVIKTKIGSGNSSKPTAPYKRSFY